MKILFHYRNINSMSGLRVTVYTNHQVYVMPMGTWPMGNPIVGDHFIFFPTSPKFTEWRFPHHSVTYTVECIRPPPLKMKMFYFQDVLKWPSIYFISQKDVLSFRIILICVWCYKFSNHLGVMKDKELKLEEIETSLTDSSKDWGLLW